MTIFYTTGMKKTTENYMDFIIRVLHLKMQEKNISFHQRKRYYQKTYVADDTYTAIM